jgi:hypothetical protein
MGHPASAPWQADFTRRSRSGKIGIVDAAATRFSFHFVTTRSISFLSKLAIA